VVDSTFATPLGQQPLRLGADIVVHSATKFIGGHSDLMAGIAVTTDAQVHDRLRRHRLVHGAMPGALETFLALRGLRTLAVRLERSAANAAVLAERLEAYPAVARVRYPGLASHPRHEAAARFMDGFGSVLSFELQGDDAADRAIGSLEMIVHATSLGGVETLVSHPASSSHRQLSDVDLAAAGMTPGTLRVSIGLEDAEDLVADLVGAAASD
jgi:cystathionine beta-lyase/cystathionine gamma-synthase